MKRSYERHGYAGTKLYHIWNDMRQRCNNPNATDYHLYGGQGVAVCPEWNSRFVAFRDWAIANGYRDGMSLDRKKSERNYGPDNCRWIPVEQQVWNRRKLRRPGGHSPFIGVTYDVLHKRWQATITTDGKWKRIGRFKTAVQAALAYDDRAFQVRGEVARLNFPERIRLLISRKEGALR